MSVRSMIASFVQRENETLDVDEIHVAVNDLPRALCGVRFALIADLHMERVTPYHFRVYDAVRRANPHFIVIAGDTIDGRTKDVPQLVPFFTQLARVAPCIAILGNNDCGKKRTPQLRTLYEAAGVLLLENETRVLPLYGSALRITGLTDPMAIRLNVHRERPVKNPQRVSMREALQPGRDTESEAIPTLLIVHQPQLAENYTELSPSLIVAGHAHGGQFRLPWGKGVYAPGQGVLPRYTSGLYAIDGSQLVVSRGLGNHGFPVRLNNRPHLPVVVLGE